MLAIEKQERQEIDIRDGFKTQPPGDRRFRPVSIVLNNGNRPEPGGTAG